MQSPFERVFDSAGRVNIDSLARVLSIDKKSLAESFRIKTKILEAGSTPEELQEPIKRIVPFLAELAAYFEGDWDAVIRWLKKPHPALDNFTPLQVVAEGNANAVIGMILARGAGEPG